MKRILTVLLALSLAIFGASCGESTTNDDTTTTTSKTELKFETPTSLTDDAVGFQFEMPEIGEEIAVLTIKDYGVIKIRLFPDSAPKTVTNFKTLIKEGYYDGLTFHRVIENFMIQGGDPNGDGSGGQSMWGEPFEDEFNANLLNFTGSVAMANSGPDTNGSQFFINNVPASYFAENNSLDAINQYYQSFLRVVEQYREQFQSQYGDEWEEQLYSQLSGSAVHPDKVTDEIWQMYNEKGGNISLDGALSALNKGHAVFGQVFEGMDVVDAISKCETDSRDKPVGNVVIEKAEIVTYEG